MKVFEIFAGVNGAGKSTLYKVYHEKDFVRVNTDEIVTKMGLDWRDMEAQTKAARISIKTIQECIKMGKSFNQETTLAGQSIKRQIKQIKKQGYKIDLYYVGVASPEIAIERVKHRVMQGGHGIPEEDIRRRYEVSLQNLKEVFPLCDVIKIYDNTKQFQMVLSKEDNKIWLSSSLEEVKWQNNIIKDIVYAQIKEDIVKSGFKPTEQMMNALYEASKLSKRLLTLSDVKKLHTNKEELKLLLQCEIEKVATECVQQEIIRNKSYVLER